MLLSEARLALVDVETTGLGPNEERVIELACAIVAGDGVIESSCAWLIDPGRPLPEEITKLTGIRPEQLVNKPSFGMVAGPFEEMVSSADAVCAYNARFDRSFIGAEWCRSGRPVPLCLTYNKDWIDPLVWVREFYPWIKGAGRHKLVNIAKHLGVEVAEAHRALGDIATMNAVWRKLLPKILHGFGYDPDIEDFLLSQNVLEAEQRVNYLTWLKKKIAEDDAKAQKAADEEAARALSEKRDES